FVHHQGNIEMFSFFHGMIFVAKDK
ncbi:uncharacterized protein METZ01_LOCUS336293, partial [marine metagenome]